MAVESLTKVQLRSLHKEKATGSDGELARALGVSLKDLDSTIRKIHLLNGDEDCYGRAKRASDGLEHGFLAFREIHAHAAVVHERLAQHVRSAIFRLSTLDQTVAATLLAEPYDKPLGVWPLVKFIRGKLIGRSPDLAAPEQAYPFVTWRSTVSSCVFDAGGKMNMQVRETLTPRLGEGISLRLSSIQIWRGGSGVNLEAHVPRPTPTGTFEITSVSQSGTTQIGDCTLSVDEPVTRKWTRPIAALVLNTNAIRHMALFWIHKLGGERLYDLPRASFADNIRTISQLLERMSLSEAIRSECTACWAEALVLDHVREKVSLGAVLPEGLALFDERTQNGAPIIHDVRKLAELSDKAMQLAKRLAELMSKVAEPNKAQSVSAAEE